MFFPIFQINKINCVIKIVFERANILAYIPGETEKKISDFKKF